MESNTTTPNLCPGTGTLVGDPTHHSIRGGHMRRTTCPVCGKGVGQRPDGTVNRHQPR